MTIIESKILNAHLLLRPRPLGGVLRHRECQLSWAFHVRVVTFLLVMVVFLGKTSQFCYELILINDFEAKGRFFGHVWGGLDFKLHGCDDIHRWQPRPC